MNGPYANEKQEKDVYKLYEAALLRLARGGFKSESGPSLNEARYKALIEAAHELGFELEAIEPDARTMRLGYRILNEEGKLLAQLRYRVASSVPELKDLTLGWLRPELSIERDDSAWQVSADKILWPEPPHPAQVWHALWELAAAREAINWATVPAPEVQLFAAHLPAMWRWRVTLKRQGA